MDNHVVTEKRDCKTKMLVLTLITFMCFSLFPFFTLEQIGGINIYTTDIARISLTGMKISDIEEGEIVNLAGEKRDETLEKLIGAGSLTREDVDILKMSDEDRERFGITEERRNEIIKKGVLALLVISFTKIAPQIEETILPIAKQLRLPFLVMLSLFIIIVLFFIVMMIASAKNNKLFYRLAAITNLIIILSLSIGISFVFDIDYSAFMGGGMIWTTLLLVLCLFIPFIKKKDKKA